MIEAPSSHHHLRFKTFVMILLVVIFSPLGNVLLDKGMKSVGPLDFASTSAATQSIMAVFTSPFIWLGIACLIAFFIAYTLVLSWADYSFVQPAAAIAYGVTAILGHFVMHESVTPLRWIGVAVICAGVYVVGRTPPRTTEHS
jgi:drug/metabolite transporter (DMT)-like permease